MNKQEIYDLLQNKFKKRIRIDDTDAFFGSYRNFTSMRSS